MRYYYYVALILVFHPIYLFSQPQPCEGEAEMTPLCADACIICDIDNFGGRHFSEIPGVLPSDFCTFVVHNAQWIAFLAGSEDLVIEISVSNCQQNRGLEIAIYESLDCQNFSLISNCFGGRSEPVNSGETAIVRVDEKLQIGQYYYIAMDGAFGDNCNWTLNVLEGSTQVDPLSNSGVISGNEKACPDSQTTYQTSAVKGAASYAWELNGAPIGEDDQSVTIDWQAEGIYQLCVTASNVCDEAPPSCKTIRVEYIPTQNINVIICKEEVFQVNDSIQLSEAGVYEFNFMTEEGCDSLVLVDLEVFEFSATNIQTNICEGDRIYIGEISYFQTGQYIDTLPNYLGCDSIVSLDLNVVICEIEGMVSVEEVRCFGENSGQIRFQIENGTAPFSYTWRNVENTLVGSGQIANLNEVTLIEQLPIGTYIIEIIDDFNNDLILIETINSPDILNNNWLVSDYNEFNISCFDAEDGFLSTRVNGGIPPYQFSWRNGEINAQLEQLRAGNYAISITDSRGCQLLDSFNLTQPEPLSFEVEKVDPNCEAYETGRISVVNINGGVPDYRYRFQEEDFQTENIRENLPPNIYTLAVEDGNGCLEQTSILLFEPLIPFIQLDAQVEVFLGEMMELNPRFNIPIESYDWSPQEGLSCYDCPNPMVLGLKNETYILTVTSSDGCARLDSININIIERRRVYVPTVFSPNDDNANDFLSIFAGSEATLIKSFILFDRWGNQLLNLNNFEPNTLVWDGSIRGEKVTQAVYTWVAEVSFIDGVDDVFSGDVLVLSH